jgi:hypothetical protein
MKPHVKHSFGSAGVSLLALAAGCVVLAAGCGKQGASSDANSGASQQRAGETASGAAQQPAKASQPGVPQQPAAKTERHAAAPQLKTYAVPGTSLSVGYPKHWKAMTPDEVQTLTKGRMQVTPQCVLFLANPSNYGQNVNIQITDVPGQKDLSDEEMSEQLDAMLPQMAQKFSNFEEVKHGVSHIAGLPAMDMTFRSSFNGVTNRQRSISFIKSEKLYTVTCTAPDSEYDATDGKALQPIVDSIVIRN